MENKRNLILVGLLGLLALTLGRSATAQVKEALKVPDSIVVVFQGQPLPADAADRVQRAGGKVVSSLDEVGILVASPVLVDANMLIRNLRKDSAILDADYDLVLELVPPAQVSVEEENDLSPETHFPHPLPTFSPALPPDFFYTSTPQQWSVKRVGAAGGGVPAPPGDPTTGAWDVTKGDGAKIAILDTGVNTTHPDVGANLIFNRALTFDIPAAFGTPNCEVPDTSNPPFDLPFDQIGHGTWTSSLAAGQIGGGLMIGVAPQAKILNIKVLRNRPATPAELQQIDVPDTPFNRCQFRTGSGLFSWVLQGILLANQQGADIISMSLGGAVPRNIPGGLGAAIWSAFNRVTNFVTSRGSLILAAAGNAATDLNRIGPVVVLPAESPHVIAVVATTNPMLFPPTPPARQACSAGADCLAFYSDFGSSLHGLAAPGGDLPSGGCAFAGSPCLPTGFVRGACSPGVPGTVNPVPAGYPETGPPPAGTSWGCFSFVGAAQHAWYVQAIGTSAATPIAAGAAALVKSANPTLNPAQIRTILEQSAQDIGKVGYDQLFNFGLVDAAAAVLKAIQF
jgi:lantibiotic leader peptide-processing serine protease